MDLPDSIGAVVGDAGVVPAAALAERATSYWDPSPMQGKLLVRPESTEQLSRVMTLCHEAGQSVVVQGGLTGVVEGALATPDDVIVSLERMTAIESVDEVEGVAVIQAGAVLQTVQEALRERGFLFPLDLGARGSCTIGGAVATNAGGINVLRYGMMRNLVLGLETVLSDGTIVSSLNRMLKNNAGYDTKQLFIGSEGSLGIVTRAVLRLFPQPASRQNAFVAFDSFDNVVRLLSFLQKELAGTLSAFEVMWNDYYHEVTGEGWHRPPLARDYPFYVVFQAEGSDPAADEARFERVLESAFEKGMIVDAALPKSETEVRDMWNIREDFEAVLEMQPNYLFDVSLPIRDMEAYVNHVYACLEKRVPDARAFTLGHIADGNLHLFVAPCTPGDHHDVVNECVYDPLRPYGGSVSAEHGIGMDKIKWLPHSRAPADIELMRTLKRTLDPKGILNPDRVLPRN